MFFVEAQPGSHAAQQDPATTAPAPTMLLYLTDGSSIAAASQARDNLEIVQILRTDKRQLQCGYSR
jgi:hypothetical protein